MPHTTGLKTRLDLICGIAELNTDLCSLATLSMLVIHADSWVFGLLGTRVMFRTFPYGQGAVVDKLFWAV